MKRIHALALAMTLGLAGLTYTYAQSSAPAKEEKSCCADCCCCKGAKGEKSDKMGAMCPMKK